MAKSLNEKIWTSTLLISPKKSIEQLRAVGEEISKEYNIKFIAPDYRKDCGTQEQNIVAKRDKLYRQDYCRMYVWTKNSKRPATKVSR